MTSHTRAFLPQINEIRGEHSDDMSTYSASAAVGEVLRQPDDLLKLSAYRAKLLKEKATLDAKLASGVKAQLDATRDALLKLQNARATVGMIREEMMLVEKLKGGEESGEAFDKITRVRSGLSFCNGSLGWSFRKPRSLKAAVSCCNDS